MFIFFNELRASELSSPSSPSFTRGALDCECGLASDFPGMTKTQFRLGVAAIFAAILLFNLTSPDRYHFINATSISSGKMIVGVTGNMYLFKDGEWINIVDIKRRAEANKK